jgi:predicted AAA+ superfamily ATPase
MVRRQLEKVLPEVIKTFPVLAIVGPRQSGKTTLCRSFFPEKPYVSFENPDNRDRFDADPRGFLSNYTAGAIFDEAQNCPKLFSYLQEIVDGSSQMGRFILTGSQQFRLNSGISQSLAGRVASFRLLPFSYAELRFSRAYGKQMSEVPLDAFLLKGSYPPIYDREPNVAFWYGNYVQTYVERDVRSLLNVNDLGTFQKFIRLCAARNGQLVNFSEIGEQAGVSHNTIKSWISILETSCILFLLRPFHTNFSKRLVKTTKLYFYDTGLLCWLLSIKDPAQLNLHPMRGAIFESFVISELLKDRFNRGEENNLYFWRDQNGSEIDVLIDHGIDQTPLEIKSGMTFRTDYCRTIKKWEAISNSKRHPVVIYGGDESFSHQNCTVKSWRTLGERAD